MSRVARRKLRASVCAAIERGGIRFDPDAHLAYLARRSAIAAPIAARIAKRLHDCSKESTTTQLALIDGVPMMSAFACSATDALYRLLARRTDFRDEARLGFSLFVVSTAAFDHICDADIGLVPTLTSRITETRLTAALHADPAPVFAAPDDVPLVSSVTVLLDDQVGIWRRLTRGRSDSGMEMLAEQFVTALTAMLRDELQSASIDVSDGLVGRRAVWQEPLWLACLLIAASEDADSTIQLESLRERTHRVGRLLSLVDDAVDIDQDWRGGGRNQLLARAVNGTRDVGDAAPPWDAILSDAILPPYTEEITMLVAELMDPIYQEDLAGWLFSWVTD